MALPSRYVSLPSSPRPGRASAQGATRRAGSDRLWYSEHLARLALGAGARAGVAVGVGVGASRDAVGGFGLGLGCWGRLLGLGLGPGLRLRLVWYSEHRRITAAAAGLV